jgi:hypothetical protein
VMCNEGGVDNHMSDRGDSLHICVMEAEETERRISGAA